jgi:hypothetical protein
MVSLHHIVSALGWNLRALAERLGLVEPLVSVEDEAAFRSDPVVRLAAELMDPLYGQPVPPSPLTAAELRVRAEAVAAERPVVKGSRR